jgi:tetratricopeptide (TPR) repeat protein
MAEPTSTHKASAYAAIAKELVKLSEPNLALKVCERGLARYPEASNILVFRGEIYVALFNRDKKPDFAKAALVSFKQALGFDPHNYLAKLISAQLYLKGGAVDRARELVDSLLETDPSDERAKALRGAITKIDVSRTPIKEDTVRDVAVIDEIDAEGDEELVVSKKIAAEAQVDEVVIGSSIEEDDDHMHDALASKLSIFSRLDGLQAVFLLDANGQPFRVINKAKLDENVIPSMVFNLFKASANSIRRCGLGSFQRGTLYSPVGVIVMANAFYATLAVIVDQDANMTAVDKRITRYLSEVSE